MNSLGIDKDPKDTRVVVAMSGGVDSSVAAALLHEQGYDVVGVTLRLFDYGQAVAKSKTCCAGQDIYDAKRVAEERGFPHYVLDYESKFRDSVIDDFADSYLRGQTPIPCVRCNQSVKFRDLLKAAHDLGADCMATGHYIQRKVNGHGAELHRAVDDTKDQSYFLFATTQEQLDFLRFPLGGWSKDITRAHAERLGLANAEKPDSQDICFVPNGDYAGVVKKLRPESEKPGDIVHVDGRVLGHHKGIIHYTIGQRKGIGIGGGHNDNNDPFYVIALEPESNRVIVGPKEALARDTIEIADCNWLLGDWDIGNWNAGKLEDGNEAKKTSNIPTFQHSNIQVKFRSTMTPVPARLSLEGQNRAKITLAAPQYGISPGQAAVCYVGPRVLGGGWIATTGNG